MTRMTRMTYSSRDHRGVFLALSMLVVFTGSAAASGVERNETRSLVIDQPAAAERVRAMHLAPLIDFVCNKSITNDRGENHRIDMTARLVGDNEVWESMTIRGRTFTADLSRLARMKLTSSRGEVGSLLRGVYQALLDNAFDVAGDWDDNGRTGILARRNGIPAAKEWVLYIGGVEIYPPFVQEVWLNSAGDLVKVRNTADSLAKNFGIPKWTWTVDYRTRSFDGEAFLLPVSSETEIVRTKAPRSWARTEFRDFRRYRTETKLTYPADPAPALGFSLISRQ